MKRTLSAVWLAMVVVEAVALQPSAAADPPRETELHRFPFVQVRMGTPIHVVIYAASEEQAENAARLAYERIGELDTLLSDYRPDSELMRLCRDSGPGRPVKVSEELFRVLQTALNVSQATDGAFDVTVGPLVKLWRRARKEKRLPPAEEIAAARSLIGWQHVVLSEADRTVELKQEGMQLDLGGIAKGYAVSQAMQLLRDAGLQQCMINAGGDLAVGEPPPGETGWGVAVQKLGATGRTPEVLSLKNSAVATSGDAFQFVEIDGVRYSHIVDAKTGVGMTSRSEVTVIGKDGTTADAWATALSVLGGEQGLPRLDRHTDAAALVQSLETDTAGQAQAVSRASARWPAAAP